MRPVLLRMEGFASFKDAALVDFRGADYFALVGPTGSGKSTVIDALTFALFGSVPRWNDQRMVSLALAPNVNRGTVSLVFDAGGARYVATRELRRTKTGVGVKNARLERLADPEALAEVTDETDSLAADSAMTPAVEELLGLSFDNFCQCVVLPQGEFAEFLRAKASDRQKILLRLLGAERYDQIGSRANSLAALAAREVEVLTGQLADFADATPEAEQDLADREQRLRTLEEQVTGTAPTLLQAVEAVESARTAVEATAAQRAALAAVAVPEDVSRLADQHARAVHAQAAAALAVSAAEAADNAARQELSTAPARTPLEQARAAHAEHAVLTARLPELTDAEATATEALRAAAAAEQGADAEQETARSRAASAAEAAASSRAAADGLRAEVAALTSVRAPRGVGALATQVRAANERAAELAAAAGAAAREAEEAGTQAPTGADRAAVQRALSLTQDVSRLDDTLRGLAGELSVVASEQQQVVDDVLDRQRALLAAQDQLMAARSANLAAALRPELVAGAPCPVCAQDVVALPAPLAAPEMDRAEDAVRAVEALLVTARDRQAVGEQARARLSARQEVLTGQRSAAVADLTGLALPADIEAAPGVLHAAAALAAADDRYEQLASAATAAQLRATQAGRAAADAAATRDQLASEVTAAVTALRAARDPLVALGAPDLDTSDVEHGWAQLAAWSAEQGSSRQERLHALDAAAADEEAAADRAQQALAASTTRLQTLRSEHLAATSSAQRASGVVEQTRRRLAELDAALGGAPGDAEAAALLAARDALEASAEAAAQGLLAARRAQRSADEESTRLDTGVETAWAQLRTIRDRFVELGAPDLPPGSLAAAWASLVEWTRTQSAARISLLTEQQDQLAAAEQQVESLAAEVVELLAVQEVPVPGHLDGRQVALAAATIVGRHVERVAAERAALADTRAREQRMRDKLEAATTQEQVARKLGNLLRSTGFPRWLAASALDTLVLDASASLSELSGGQFELTHDKGDFFVVDHADADARRSVRTLSGGETFQASLALALALSSQLGTLGAGATRLDSIFLDEGFGTLDAATLDTVATTLENLASTDRMVGIVTHVPALAERVPIRYAVTRDQRTSRVVREDA